MKKLIPVVLAAGLLGIMTTEASAVYCEAHSRDAYGWGRNQYEGAAKRRALYECAKRTPRYQTCYIRTCRY